MGWGLKDLGRSIKKGVKKISKAAKSIFDNPVAKVAAPIAGFALGGPAGAAAGGAIPGLLSGDIKSAAIGGGLGYAGGTLAGGLGAAGGSGLSGLFGGAAPAAASAGAIPTATGIPGGIGASQGLFSGLGGGGISLETLGTIGAIGAPLIGGQYLATGEEIKQQEKALKEQQKLAKEGKEEYLQEFKEATTWSDEDRKNYMKAIMGQFSEAAQAAKRKASNMVANLGAGGGAYGRQVEKIEQAGREAAARALSETYGPSGQVPAASIFQLPGTKTGRSAEAETMSSLFDIAGQAGTLYMLSSLF